MDKTWIHQIVASMQWQESNYKLLKEEYEQSPTAEALNAYIESYGKYCALKGRYMQWHKDAQEVKAGTF